MNEFDTRSDDVFLLEWANVLLSHRLLIIFLTLAAGAIAFCLCKRARPLYTAETKLTANRDAAQLSLKGLFGGNLPRSMTEVSDRYTMSFVSSYYAELLRSDPLLRPLIRRAWHDGRTLAGMYEIEEGSKGSVQDQTLSRLRNKLIDIQQDRGTGILTVRTTTVDPQLSADMANSLVDGLQTYLQESRTSGTGRLLRAAEERTSLAQTALQLADSRLHEFRRSNRTIVSPELQLRLEQLQREVELQKELYIRLKTQVELLRLTEQHEEDLIEVIQAAKVPIHKSWPPTKAAVAGAAVFGFLLATGLAFLRNGIRKLAERNAPGSDEFIRHIRALNWVLPGLILLLPASVRRRDGSAQPGEPRPAAAASDEVKTS